jgi:hypothetical protein
MNTEFIEKILSQELNSTHFLAVFLVFVTNILYFGIRQFLLYIKFKKCQEVMKLPALEEEVQEVEDMLSQILRPKSLSSVVPEPSMNTSQKKSQ